MADSLLDEELLDILGSATAAPGNISKSTDNRQSTDQSPKGKTSRSKPSGKQSQSQKGKQKKKKRRRNGSDDDDDEEDDDISDDGFGGDYERSSDIDLDLDGSSAAAKRRKRRSNKHNEDPESDDDEDGDGLTEEERLMLLEPSEDDLAGLNELEREQKLADWADKKQALLEKIQIKRRLKRQSSSEDSSRLDVRAKRKSKLEELRIKRSGGKKKPSADIDEAEDDEDEYAGKIKSAYSKDGNVETKQLELKDMLQCQVTREELEKWMFAPFFEDTIVRGFVRLMIGMDPQRQQSYRLCQIIGVEEYHRAYKVNGILTKKVLRLKHGKAEKVFLMDVVSNQPLLESEFTRWLRTMSAEHVPVPLFSEIQRVQKLLVSARSHIFTNQEIDAMIQHRNQYFPVQRNLANRKLQLIASLQEAKTNGHQESVSTLQRELDDVAQTISDRHSEKYDGSKAQLWAQLNERNRKKNLEDGRSAELRLREEKHQLQKQGKTLDPFARIRAAETLHLIVNTDVMNASNEQLSSEPQSGQQSAKSGGSGAITPNEYSEETASKPTMAFAMDKVFADIDFDI